jgi:hypothetical protein
MGICAIIFKEWRVTWTFSYTYATINKKNKQQNIIGIRAFDSRSKVQSIKLFAPYGTLKV